MNQYIWSNNNWPEFRWDNETVLHKYMIFLEQKLTTSTAFNSIIPESRKQIYADVIASDATASSDLEGVSVSYDSVYSSIAAMLELDIPKNKRNDRNASFMAAILKEASETKVQNFNIEKILSWHKMLFEGLSGSAIPKHTGAFRTKPVYVMRYSGSMEGTILYEGVPAERIPEEMEAFLTFIKNEEIPRAVRSAVSAAWFPLIHPFEDGNGRLSRIIADMILFDGDGPRCISVSTALRKNRKGYYANLEKLDNKDDMDITFWICWYLDVLIDAMKIATDTCTEKIRLSSFMATLDPSEYNSREISMLYRLASGSFYGKLTADKWKKLTKCTSATATRDLTHLVEKGLLERDGDGGRGTWYRLSSIDIEGK